MGTQKKETQQESLAFESTMKSIEKLLEKLENSDTPLNQSLQAFEEGIQLIRKAQKTLQEAEQKVQLLLDQDGSPVAAPFSLEDDSQ